MARVYRATDTLLQRQVALKILAPRLGDDPDFARRFAREAVTAANLRHPAIITIFDVGEIEGYQFIAMEYVAGRSLGEALDERGRLDLALVIAALQPVADALDYAHQQGAVHRDVKPGNILIDTDGRVLLTDFGIALGPKDRSERLTEAGSFMGTPEYLSPEQVQAQPLTGQSDLYSLGVVAWEALAGRPPFAGATGQLLIAHVTTPPPSLSAVAPSLPKELDAILARALAKAPAMRYARAAEMIELLRRTALHYHIPPAGRREIASLAAPHHSSAGQATVALETPATHGGIPSKPAAFPIADIFGTAPQGSSTEAAIGDIFGAGPAAPQPELRPAVRGDNGVAPVRTAAARSRRTPAQQRATLPPPAPAASRTDLLPRRAEGVRSSVPWPLILVGIIVVALLIALALQSAGRSTRSAGNTGEPLQAVFGPSSAPASPAGSAVARVEAAPASATEAASATTSTSAVPGGAAGSTVPSRPTPIGGAELIYESDGSLNLLDRDAGTFRSIASAAQSRGPSAISPDGATLIFDALDGQRHHLFRWDKASGKATAFVQAVGDQYHPAWTGDGKSVLYVSTQDGNAEIYKIDAAGSRPERLTVDPAEDDYPSSSPDGKQMVWERQRDGHWQIFGMTIDGFHNLVQPVPDHDDRYPRISPDGTRLVFASNRDRRDGGYDLYIQPLPVGTPRRLTDLNGGSAGAPQWSPDGSRIVFSANLRGNDDIYFLSASGGEPERLTNGPANHRWPVWGR